MASSGYPISYTLCCPAVQELTTLPRLQTPYVSMGALKPHFSNSPVSRQQRNFSCAVGLLHSWSEAMLAVQQHSWCIYRQLKLGKELARSPANSNSIASSYPTGCELLCHSKMTARVRSANGAFHTQFSSWKCPVSITALPPYSW